MVGDDITSPIPNLGPIGSPKKVVNVGGLVSSDVRDDTTMLNSKLDNTPVANDEEIAAAISRLRKGRPKFLAKVSEENDASPSKKRGWLPFSVGSSGKRKKDEEEDEANAYKMGFKFAKTFEDSSSGKKGDK